jgi:hypothetical protein
MAKKPEKKLTRWTQFAPDPKPRKGKKQRVTDAFCEKWGIKIAKVDGGKRWVLRFGTRKKRLMEWVPDTGIVTLDGRHGGKDIGWPKLQKRLERILLAELLGSRPLIERKRASLEGDRL